MPNYKIGIELNADDNASDKLGKVKGAAAGLGDAFSTGGLALGGALIGVGIQASQLASQVEQSTAKMTTQLALTDEEASRFEQTMRDIYADNSGESFADVAESLVTVEQGFERIGGLAPEALKQVTEDALAMRDAFEYEVGDTVGATATLMENFGLTSVEAMDFLVAAQQKGLNSSGDLLDTIGEYSVQFSDGGASAGEFFAILEEGNAGGVLGTDKAADAFKEFNIRIKDDSTTTKTALEEIGISYDTLKQGFTDGSITTMDAMQLVIDKINEIEDPVERAKAGVALFGTQWEDLGEAGVLALGNVEDQLGETEGAAETLNAQYKTNASEIEAATREWEDALVDVGEEMNALGAEVMPWLAEQMRTYLVPGIGLLAEFISNLREGQSAWDSFINGLWSFAPDFSWQGAGGTPLPVQKEPSSAPTPSAPTTPNLPQAQASGMTVNIYGNADTQDVVDAGRRMGMR